MLFLQDKIITRRNGEIISQEDFKELLREIIDKNTEVKFTDEDNFIFRDYFKIILIAYFNSLY